MIDRQTAFLANGKSETDGGAVAGNTGDADFAAVTANVGLADAEAQAGAFPAFGGEEGFEDVRENVGGNALAGVGNGDFDALIELHFFGGDGNGAAFGHGLSGVEQKVHQYLRELVGIGGY